MVIFFYFKVIIWFNMPNLKLRWWDAVHVCASMLYGLEWHIHSADYLVPFNSHGIRDSTNRRLTCSPEALLLFYPNFLPLNGVFY